MYNISEKDRLPCTTYQRKTDYLVQHIRERQTTLYNISEKDRLPCTTYQRKTDYLVQHIRERQTTLYNISEKDRLPCRTYQRKTDYLVQHIRERQTTLYNISEKDRLPCTTYQDRVKWWVSYKRQKLFTLSEHLGSSPVFWWVLFIVLGFSVVFLFFVCPRLVHPMLPVSLDCPLLIAPSVFSCNAYFICLMWGVDQHELELNAPSKSTYY